MREVAPRTQREYDAALRLAFGTTVPPFPDLNPVVAEWSYGRRVVLRAALTRALEVSGMDTESAKVAVRRTVLLPARRARREVPHPPEEAVLAFEAQAKALPATWETALALLPLAVGFRAQELLTLSHVAVADAVKTGTLLFKRKGGSERTLDITPSRDLFQALLDAPKKWTTVGELLSPASYGAQYVAYNKLIHQLSGNAIRPHILRHIFAERMRQDGADLVDIQTALGHQDIATTRIYLSGDIKKAARHMRTFTL